MNSKSSDALDTIFTLLEELNNILMKQCHGHLLKMKQKRDRLATVLYNLIESIRFAAIALIPYMPSTANKILDQINTDQRDLLALDTFGTYKEGTKVS